MECRVYVERGKWEDSLGSSPLSGRVDGSTPFEDFGVRDALEVVYRLGQSVGCTLHAG
jgi:hypothetical protein